MSDAGLSIFFYKDTRLVSTVPATTDEPFSLESLQDLIIDHEIQGKHLYIARVGTLMDPADAKSARFFYYAATELNKLIFRTFGENGAYLFRMHALNPLTNTEMVGNVDYYRVQCHSDIVAQHKQGRRRSSVRLKASLPKLTTEPTSIAEIVGPKRRISASQAHFMSVMSIPEEEVMIY